jgi:flavin-binding protein dodecin
MIAMWASIRPAPDGRSVPGTTAVIRGNLRDGVPDSPGEAAVSNHVYRVIEVVGSSPEGLDAAIRNAIARASATTRNLDWFEVTEIRGQLAAGDVAHVQVGLKIGFRLEEP